MNTPEFERLLRATLDHLRKVGWLDAYTFDGHMPGVIVWSSQGLANLALLRAISKQAGLTKDPGIAQATCWLAESYGPNIGRS